MLAPKNLPPDDVGFVAHPGTGESHDRRHRILRADGTVAVIGKLIRPVVLEVVVVRNVLQVAGDAPVEASVVAGLGIDVVHRFPLGAVAILRRFEGIPERLHHVARPALEPGIRLEAVGDAEEHGVFRACKKVCVRLA